jgi:hypothetical protein
MRYSPELYYLQDRKNFAFRKAVLVTATTVAQWCSYYDAKLLAPKDSDLAPKQRTGALPSDSQEKEVFLNELINWIFENSWVDDLFVLFLDDGPVPRSEGVAKFDHHDDTCCWVLNLSEGQYAELQAAWKAHDLPRDLFYPPPEVDYCIPYQGDGLKARLYRFLGVKNCYTPKQWEMKFGSLDIADDIMK